MPRVVNNTVLSNFCLVGRLDLLQALFSKVYITYEVREEVLRGIDEGYAFMERAEGEIGIGKEAWLELVGFESPAEEQSFRDFTRRLGYGEASCLAIAQHRGWLVLTDDLAARRALRQVGLEVTGTLGILRLAVERGLLSLAEGNELLRRMIEGGYHSPYDDLEEI
ncbi:MAG: DUF3368 domain-containing protein [Anaerolineae bacterium]